MRLRGLVGLGALIALAVLALTSRRSDAALRVCPAGQVEVLRLTPSGAVTDDGLILAREPDGGRFVLDSGVAFDVEAASLTALDAGVTACAEPAHALLVQLVEPFGDGGVVTVEVSR